MEQTNDFLKNKQKLAEDIERIKSIRSERKTINILGISSSSVNTDDKIVRVPSSEKILMETLELAKDIDSSVETQIVKLRDIKYLPCEANYSIQNDYCTWPCWISQRYPDTDGLVPVYKALVEWADIVIIATPIRWGNPSSHYFKFIERLNCIENQKEVYGLNIIQDQIAGFIIVGAQDGVQHSLGEMMAFWTQQGFSFTKYPYIGYTSGNYSNTKTKDVTEQILKDKEVIEQMQTEMLTNQIEAVKRLRRNI
ncbi:MAG: NAD(P)H-dependent oxidoreductase [bacterium]